MNLVCRHFRRRNRGQALVIAIVLLGASMAFVMAALERFVYQSKLTAGMVERQQLRVAADDALQTASTLLENPSLVLPLEYDGEDYSFQADTLAPPDAASSVSYLIITARAANAQGGALSAQALYRRSPQGDGIVGTWLLR